MTPVMSLNQRVLRIIESGDTAELQAVRSELKQIKQTIEQQLADDKAERRGIVIAAINDGREPGEAVLMEADWDWRTRALSLLRRINGYMARLKERLGSRRNGAVVVAGAGKSAATVAAACNDFINRGCWIVSIAIVGTDLVIIASAPTMTEAE